MRFFYPDAIYPDSANANLKAMSSCVKVVVRIRPILDDEKEDKICLTVEKSICTSRLILNTPRSNLDREVTDTYMYDFDKCYDDSTTQQELFQREIQPLVTNVFQGMNTTVFAYGATGTGKSHTMGGKAGDPGIVPRTVQAVFKHGRTHCSYSKVMYAHLEIYNDKVKDLLAPNPAKTDLPIRQGAHGEIAIQGLENKTIESYEDFKRLYKTSCRNRQTAATALNADSSRSHSVLMLQIQSTDARSGRHHLAKLHLIDLAGSEDNRRTGNAGLRLTESGQINMSLFVLGKVIDALNDPNAIRIPFRDSKLTRLLQDSLGGSSQSVMICNIAPTMRMFQSTYQTLNYASKARQIVARPEPLEAASHSSKSNEQSMADKLRKWKESKGKPMNRRATCNAPTLPSDDENSNTSSMKRGKSIDTANQGRASSKAKKRPRLVETPVDEIHSPRSPPAPAQQAASIDHSPAILVRAKGMIAEAVRLESDGQYDQALSLFQRGESFIDPYRRDLTIHCSKSIDS